MTCLNEILPKMLRDVLTWRPFKIFCSHENIPTAFLVICQSHSDRSSEQYETTHGGSGWGARGPFVAHALWALRQNGPINGSNINSVINHLCGVCFLNASIRKTCATMIFQ